MSVFIAVLFSSSVFAQPRLPLDHAECDAALGTFDLSREFQIVESVIDGQPEAVKRQAKAAAITLTENEANPRIESTVPTRSLYRQEFWRWAFYFAVASALEAKVTDTRNFYGVVNWFTLHSSNFIYSVPLAGLSQFGLCYTYEICHAATWKFTHSRTYRFLKETIFKKRIDNNPYEHRRSHSLRKPSFLFAVALFTAVNYYFELSGIYQNYTDYTDFFTGEAGLVLYYYLAKIFESPTLSSFQDGERDTNN